jgi:hypothetical protein
MPIMNTVKYININNSSVSFVKANNQFPGKMQNTDYNMDNNKDVYMIWQGQSKNMHDPLLSHLILYNVTNYCKPLKLI